MARAALVLEPVSGRPEAVSPGGFAGAPGPRAGAAEPAQARAACAFFTISPNAAGSS